MVYAMSSTVGVIAFDLLQTIILYALLHFVAFTVISVR